MRARTFALSLSVAVPLWPDLALAADDTFAQALDRGWLWAYLFSFGFGFLTSLTPCVYPMIPIVVGVFGARDEAVTRRRAFLLATSYVLGLGVLYAVLGVTFALIGKQSGSVLANPWVVVPVVGIYLALAASMFGAFDINLPSGLQQRLARVGGRGVFGAFGMGLVGGLTAAPCTGPFLAGMLGFVASTRDVLVGSTLLFSYAVGMGVLFWVIAIFTVSLPRSGRWMEAVKSVGGIALLAVAIHFLKPIVPAIAHWSRPDLTFLLGAVGLIGAGVLLGAVHLSFRSGWRARARKTLGLVLAVVGITFVVNWALTPDRVLAWRDDESAAFAEARATGKRVMIDFAADWCLPCKELEQTFGAEGVFEAIQAGYIPLKFDVSAGSEADVERQSRYGTATLPAVIFLAADGRELLRLDRAVRPDEFQQFLRRVDAAARGALRQRPPPSL